MELYTTSSYNDTMSNHAPDEADSGRCQGTQGLMGGGGSGGETLSSVSENGSGLNHPASMNMGQQNSGDFHHPHHHNPAMAAYLVRS